MKWKLFSGRRRRPLSTPLWSRALARCRYAERLPPADRKRLREMADRFLDAKSFDGAAGLELTAEICAVVALKACVPVLNLGLDCYAGWSDIVIYPGEFRVHDEYMDEAGVVHEEARELCGQSLTRGPMVLSWQTIEEERDDPDHDLVIHECAHKLDILNGEANGFPPLHGDMLVAQWSEAFHTAFERLCDLVEADTDTALDPYAATDPAEFFAVASETFFTCPAIVRRDFPEVYAQLARYYRQDTCALLGDLA